MRKQKQTARVSNDVALWYRNSRDVQETSVERQESIVNPYVAQKAYRVVEVIKLEDTSGSDVLDTEEVQRLHALARTGRISGVVMDDLDRLSRLDSLQLGELLSPLRRSGVWIESVAQGRWDYNSMQGRMMLGISTEAKHGEIVATGRRVLSKHLHMARDLGEPPLAKPPYGYLRVEDMDRPPDARGKRHGKWVIIPEQADVVRQMFRWYDLGKTCTWIARELARCTVPTRRGCRCWTRRAVYRILGNRAYIGDREWGKHASGKFWRQRAGEIVAGDGTKHVEHRPREEWHLATGRHDAIITDRDLWSRVQARLERSRANHVLDDQGEVVRREGQSTSPAEPGTYLLSRLLVCGQCGSWMTGYRDPRARECISYVCARYLAHGASACVRCPAHERPCVNAIIERVRQLLSAERQDILRKHLRDHLAGAGRDDHLKSLKRQEKALDAALQQHRRRLAEVSRDMISEVEEVIRRDREQLRRLREEIDQTEKSDPTRDLETTIDAAGKALWRLEQCLDTDDRLALGEALRGIINHVTVEPKERTTPSGKPRYRPGSYIVHLRPGTGLDTLVDLDPSPTGMSQVLHIDLSASA